MPKQTFFSSARILQQHLPTVMLSVGFSFLFFNMSGCAASRPAIRSFWDQVPPVRWSSKGNETSKNSEKSDTATDSAIAANPAVAANVALKSGEAEDSNSSRLTKNESRRKSPFARSESRSAATETAVNETPMHPEQTTPDSPNSETVAKVERTDSSMERLNAALSNDIQQLESLPQRSLTGLDDRIRIDSLISQAKLLLEIGQLEQARKLAQLAQELGETAQVDYAPDEDRPIDLVRRIQGQLEATRLKDESNSEKGIVESPTAPAAPDKSDVATNSSTAPEATTKEASSLARLKRDWSTLFRGKKQTTQEPVSAGQNSKPVHTAPTSEPTPQDQQARRSTASEGRDAVVMANRSVSLGTLDSLSTSSASYVTESDEIEAHPTHSDVDCSTETERHRFQDRRETPPLDLAESSKPNFDADEVAEPPTDFDVAELAVPVSRAKTWTREQVQPELVEPAETSPQSDWTGLYIGFGLCGLLAAGCYRRGAT